MNKIRKKTAQFLRSTGGAFTTACTLAVTPLTLGGGGYALLNDDYNPETTEQSDAKVEIYHDRLDDMHEMNLRYRSMAKSADHAPSPEQVNALKTAEFKLKDEFQAAWQDYKKDVLMDADLTEQGYTQVIKKAKKYNANILPEDVSNSWDECALSKNASEKMECLQDRDVDGFPFFALAFFGSFATVTMGVVLLSDDTHKELADKLEKSIKQKAPKN